MFELLFAFAFWPWLLVLAFLVFCILSALTETFSWAAISLVVFSGIAWLAYDAGPLPWFYQNPWKSMGFIIVYCAIGLLWSLFKWSKRIRSKSMQDALSKAKAKFLKDPDNKDEEFYGSYEFPLNAYPSRNIDRITSWMALWPLSAFLFVFDDLLARLFTNIYEAFSGMFERITKKNI